MRATVFIALIACATGASADISDAGIPLSRTAFIVRMASNDKDLGKISNAVSWAEELQKQTPEVDFWLSVDATQDHSEFNQKNWSGVPAAGNQLIRLAPKDSFNSFAQKDSMKLQKFVTAFQEKNIPVKLHVYTEKDIIDAYPDIQEAHDQSVKACKGEKWCNQPLGWQFHNQALGLWWKENKIAYDHVWVSEPDMNFHQKLPEIVKSYAVETDKDADLVSMVIPGWPLQWMWSDTGTKSYLAKTSPPEKFATDGPLLAKTIQNSFAMKKTAGDKCMRVATPEYVQRYSSTLLDKLEDYCGVKHMCAHSEQFSVTVATCEGLKVRAMNPRLLLDVRHDGGPLR
jgi:hypothetical protein